MKPKIIKAGEPFILGDITYTYEIRDSKLILSKYKDSVKKVSSAKPGFIPPTLDEVKAFFKEKGYNEETAIRAWNHYENGEPKWTDTTGKPVKAWKQKMLTNWCKPENKIVDKPTETKNNNGLGSGMVM